MHSARLFIIDMMTPSEIRKSVRAARQALTAQEIKEKSAFICKRLRASPEYLARSRIALYLSHDNEAQAEQLLPQLWRLKKNSYLPILKPKPLSGLWFGRYEKQSILIANRYGILEPIFSQKTLIPAWTLDVALVPLVAFDLNGNRLGMGGGYYDRAFAYLHRNNHLKKPKLFGLAFECQKVKQLPHQSWDIPLDGVITEKCFYRLRSKNKRLVNQTVRIKPNIET